MGIAIYPFAIQTILSFCEGNYLFVAINREWKNIYILLFKKTETRIGSCSPQQIECAVKAGYVLSYKSMGLAAKLGNFEVMKWLHKNDCSWHEWTCAWAAKGGYFEILKWARENGCPWNTFTCSNAASRGYFDILKWAHKEGCP